MIIKKYHISNPLLKNFIKYIWMIDTKIETEVSHLLLPVNSIDLILNLSSPIKYEFIDSSEIITKEFHLCGLRKFPINITQNGKLNVIGISFLPYGLFDFFDIPVSEFTSKITCLKDISESLTNNLKEKLEKENRASKQVLIIEEELLKILNSNSVIDNSYIDIFNEFIYNTDAIKISDFCRNVGISERHLERLFKKYIGLSPKTFSRVTRFQKISKKLIENDFEKLCTLALEYQYYDQMHFIRECKDFTGNTPLKLSQEKLAVKSIINLK